jgi:hypothetical protein
VGIARDVVIGGNVTGGGIRTTSTSTAPINPTVGDIWYDTTTDGIYRFTSDGANSYWLDYTSSAVANISGITVQNTNVYANNFNGSNSYFTAGTNANWTFLHNGLADYTIEAWTWVPDTAATYTIASTDAATAQIGFSFLINNSGAGTVSVEVYRGVSGQFASFATATGRITPQQWNHVAFTFVSSTKTGTFYVNGINVGSSTNAAFAYSASAPTYNLAVGRFQAGTPGGYFNGSISNLRILNGTILYTSNFGVPAIPLTAITNTALLTCQGLFADASVNNYAIVNSGATLGLYSARQSTSQLTVDSTITLPDSSQFSTAQSFGMHNRLINGSMSIDQRNVAASQTITAAAALAYTVDRWYAYSTGASVTGQRVAGSGALQYLYQFTGAAGTTAIGFGQRIETINCYDLNGSTVTLSAFLANSLLSTVTWTAYYANTADTFGTLASPTRTQIATGSWTVSGTLTRYTTNIAIPVAARTGIEIVFTVGAQISGTWQIGAVQLEPGVVATPFEHRSIATELQLCFRYYEVMAIYTLAKGGQYDGNGWVDVITYSEKRVVPIITTSSAMSQVRIRTDRALLTSSGPVDGGSAFMNAEL